MVKDCHACIVDQPLNSNTPMQPVSLPKGPWVKGGLDIVGPIENKYLITYLNYYVLHFLKCLLLRISHLQVLFAC